MAAIWYVYQPARSSHVESRCAPVTTAFYSTWCALHPESVSLMQLSIRMAQAKFAAEEGKECSLEQSVAWKAFGASPDRLAIAKTAVVSSKEESAAFEVLRLHVGRGT